MDQLSSCLLDLTNHPHNMTMGSPSSWYFLPLDPPSGSDGDLVLPHHPNDFSLHSPPPSSSTLFFTPPLSATSTLSRRDSLLSSETLIDPSSIQSRSAELWTVKHESPVPPTCVSLKHSWNDVGGGGGGEKGARVGELESMFEAPFVYPRAGVNETKEVKIGAKIQDVPSAQSVIDGMYGGSLGLELGPPSIPANNPTRRHASPLDAVRGREEGMPQPVLDLSAYRLDGMKSLRREAYRRTIYTNTLERHVTLLHGQLRQAGLPILYESTKYTRAPEGLSTIASETIITCLGEEIEGLRNRLRALGVEP